MVPVIPVNLEGREGVTLIAKLTGVRPGKLYYIMVKDANGPQIYFERLHDREFIRINVPQHSDLINVIVVGGPLVDEVIVTELTPLHIPFPHLPPNKRPYMPSELHVEFNNGMHTPARIFTDKPLIEINKKQMRKYNQGVAYFINLHELGHMYFDEEKKADMWATIKFLNDGYNVSTVTNALVGVLGKTPENVDRMFASNKLLNMIHNSQYSDGRS